MKVAGNVLVLLACLSVAASAPRSELHHESHGETSEVDFLEDALGEWLAKFDTYTFMVKEDVDSSNDANNTEDDEDVVPEEARESDRERTLTDDEQSSFAPISVSLDEKGLLNPDVDYQVLVESLVAEEGSVFVTLSKYENKSTCGVGGFSKESKQNLTKNHLEIEHQVETSDATIIAFAIESESSSSFPGVSSSWDQISDDFWWVQGRLVGGGVLALTFTPPECGCLTISTYYALPVGKLTLVVGPQAYPTELQTLVCIDPARYQDCNEDKEEDEEHDTEESENSIGDNDEADEQDTSLSSWVRENGNEDEDSVSGKPRLGKRHKNRKARKEARRLERIKRMQANRQRIRQAGSRRKVRQQLRQEKRKNDRKENRKRNRLNRQNGRLSKNKWKKLHKQRQNKNHQNHLNSTSVESGNSTNGEHNSTQPQVEEERLIDLLLGGTSNYSEVEGNSGNGKEDHEVDSNIVPGSEVEAETARARRKNRRQQRKDRRREKKIHHPGIKFCCKQGVKHKKYQLIINSTVEQGAVTPTTCNSTSDIVTTFANHQFAIDEESCKSNFVTCCSKFTEDMWDAIKNKKQARKTQRQERRKVRRQQRKQQRKAQRKEIRKLRKEQRRQNHWHDEDEHELKDDDETTTMSSVQA